MIKEPSYNFIDIIDQFRTIGHVQKVHPFGSGHIHDTFHVVNTDAGAPDYLLQRVNHHVFKNITGLTNNVLKVTEHLRIKLERIPGTDPSREVLSVIPSKSGDGFFVDQEGNYWRMYYFISDTKCYDMVETPAQAYEGGRAFGKFQALLSDLDVSEIEETIPEFHDIESRLRIFDKTIDRDPMQRVQKVNSEIAFVDARRNSMAKILEMGRNGQIPLRITHNDTKINNVLLNNRDEAQCVIDLDTVMPGYVAYDFGDAIRTTVNTAPEDEADTKKIQVNMELFRAFTKGFLEEIGSSLTSSEYQSLAYGTLLLPFIMGLRFLTDYIDGDNYYKISFPDHNLQRARAQFKLVERLEEHFEAIQEIIEEFSKKTVK